MWRFIPNTNEVYQINPCGEVRRVKHVKHSGIPGILKPQETRNGYLKVSLSIDGKQRYHFVHKLVALVFIGEKPEGLEINHIDGNKKNNCENNLEYVTRSENVLHSSRILKTHRDGRKVSENQVLEIIHMLKNTTLTEAEIGLQFGISDSAVNEIKLGHTFKHLTGNLDLEHRKKQKLSDEDVEKILEMYHKHHITKTEIGKVFGIHRRYVYNIINGKSRKLF